MRGKTNPIAKMMQTTDGRRIFGAQVIPAKKGRGSYKRKKKYKLDNEFDTKGGSDRLF